MFNANMFSDRLSELMFDNKIDAKTLASFIGTTKVTIYRYIKKERIPTVDMLLKLADYFKVSIDFLIGLTAENYTDNFANCPPFSERFVFLLDYFKTTKYKLEKDTGIDEASLYGWKNGKNKPSIENVLKLADYFKCSVDFILGREK